MLSAFSMDLPARIHLHLCPCDIATKTGISVILANVHFEWDEHSSVCREHVHRVHGAQPSFLIAAILALVFGAISAWPPLLDQL